MNRIIQELNADKEILLSIAIIRRDIDIVSFLITRKDCNINYSNVNGTTPLIWATVCCNGNLEIVSLLLQAGADVNHRDNNNETALTYAVKFNSLDIVVLLLENGAKEDTSISFSNTEIMSLLENVKNLDSLGREELNNLFQENPSRWTNISKYHSQKAYHYFISQFSLLLDQPKDVLSCIFPNL